MARRGRDDRLDRCNGAVESGRPQAEGDRQQSRCVAQMRGRSRAHPGQRSWQIAGRGARRYGSRLMASGSSPQAGRSEAGRLVDNIMYFARTLRAAGLPIGPGKVIAAVEALQAAGISSRDDFYWTLHAVFVQRRDQREIFDQAFHIFWKNPQFLQRMMSLLLPRLTIEQPDPTQDREISPRLSEALHGDQPAPQAHQ